MLTRPVPFGRSEFGIVSALAALAFALSLWPRPSADRRRARAPATPLGVADIAGEPPGPTAVADLNAPTVPGAVSLSADTAAPAPEIVEVRETAAASAEAPIPKASIPEAPIPEASLSEASIPEAAILEVERAPAPEAAMDSTPEPVGPAQGVAEPAADAAVAALDPAVPQAAVAADEAAAPEPAPEEANDHEAIVAAARSAWLMEPSQAHRVRLADLLKKCGDIAESRRRIDEATAHYQESVALRRTAVTAAPKDPEQQRWLWITLEALADCYEVRGLRARAAEFCTDALAAAEQAVALTPGHSSWTAELADTRARTVRLKAALEV